MNLLRPFALFTFVLSTVAATGCAPVVGFDVVITDETVVEGGGSVLENGLAGLGFDGFSTFDIEGSQEFENRGLTREHVTSAQLTSFRLIAEEPSDADLGFLNDLKVLVDAPEQPETRIAEAEIDGEPIEVAAETTDEDLGAYLRTDTFTLTADASGTRPEEDTTVRAEAILRVWADPTGTTTDPIE